MIDRSLDAESRFAALLSRFPPEVVALAKRSLSKLRRDFPGVPQLVYEYPKSLVASFSPTERGHEAIVAVSIDPRGVRLYLDKDVPDPNGRLEGAGSKVRSVALESASDLDHGDVHALVQAAIRRSGVALPHPGPGRVVFKSEAKKKSPKRRASSSKEPRSSKRSG